MVIEIKYGVVLAVLGLQTPSNIFHGQHLLVPSIYSITFIFGIFIFLPTLKLCISAAVDQLICSMATYRQHFHQLRNAHHVRIIGKHLVVHLFNFCQ